MPAYCHKNPAPLCWQRDGRDVAAVPWLAPNFRMSTLIKFLLLALGIWIVYRIVKSYGRSLKQDEAPPVTADEDMVRCAHCGVHLPRSESIVSQGEFFCGNEHRQLHQK